MPPRRRRKAKPGASAEEVDPVSRFGTMLRESAERERADQQRAEERRRQQEELEVAKSELQDAIVAARRARAAGSGIAEADATWRAAKARVIELETGEPPPWWTPSGDSTADADDTEEDSGDLT